MSDFLAGAGVLRRRRRLRRLDPAPAGRACARLAMLVAIALFPVLILGDQWHTHQIVDLRDDAAGSSPWLVVGARGRRRPGAAPSAAGRSLLPLAIVAALPFRVPLHAGGDTANLLVPLYLVIAAGVARHAAAGLDAPARAASPAHAAAAGCRESWPPFVVLYALQTLYSRDFSKGLQNVCFFLVPFSVAYALLRDVEWDRRLLTPGARRRRGRGRRLRRWSARSSTLTRSLFWNDQVIRSNEFHTYFRVNSVFWDPNVYGRYLALVIVVAMAALLWAQGAARPSRC